MAGVIQGKEQNRFEPQGDATRAEAAKMLYEFMTVVDEQEELQ